MVYSLYCFGGKEGMDDFYDNIFGINNNITIISNKFLEEYLADTKPEYIKVFLFYLWKGIKEGYSISDTSNEIDLDENIVEMALKFWVKKRLIKSECLTYGKVNNGDDKVLIDFNKKKNEIINKNRKNFSDVEKDLLFVAEKLLGKTISERQQALISKCYNEFFFDESLIQYLFEYCSNIEKTDARYMTSVATSWYEQNIKTVDEAKKLAESINSGTSKKSVKNKATRVLDRKDDIDELFNNAIASGKFK